MAFHNNHADRVGDQKQHLNLSVYAYDVIHSDMLLFDNQKITNFLNLIFDHYRLDAEASISLVLGRYRSELDDIFSKIKTEDKTKKVIIDTFVERKKNMLINKAAQYEKGNYFKFYLNKKNFEYLTGDKSDCDEPDCNENDYYKNCGQYIKSVIEEYARLPYVERERIYYKERISIIEKAIKEKKQLHIITGSKKIYYVYPYKILQDPLATTNYLVGFSYSDIRSKEQKIPCSFKIAALQTVKMKTDNGKITAKEEAFLEQKIERRGVQFMVGEETRIRIRLTEAGVYRYNRYIHLRPAVSEIQEPNIYVFNCTETQAQFYFFKFGADAEVLEPERLRKHFQEMYRDAANLYHS